MAENFGKPGGRMTQRRDPRVDPDDDEMPVSAPRVDVVSVERASPGHERSHAPERREPAASSSEGEEASDPLTNAALVLRRELAKLHQQAAAVERTIDDQRRERSDALERIETA